ncbi:hypothetical protein AVEN_79339-1 [Araneus ventricosus]|uniref:Uncharacterized protein n=1 Tax=Araneus ventricosus TaxID=182803 RepID=A0A4Y2J253_ARAVE|nr:hypothetical protein AVEN_79339-1 [Araneus ventricosus]
MPQSTENPADCEIRSVSRFLDARYVKVAEIHRQVSKVNRENIMSEGMHLKKHLGGQHHDDDDDLKMAMLAADFYVDGIQNLVVRYEKCLNIGGNYVEK